VLLVDDFVDSGWTMTLAARALRRAGAADVVPFALAITGRRD
jgi:ATP-dependent DNA helicase RecQ